MRVTTLLLAGLCSMAALAAPPVKQPGIQAAHGIGLIPEPKVAHIESGEFTVGPRTAIFLDRAVADRAAVESLIAGIRKRCGVKVAETATAPVANRILLERATPDDVPAAQRGKEAYTLVVDARGAVIRASHAEGLYYGAQTLLQLLAQGNGKARMARIADWPDMSFRAVHVDLWYHQDRPWYYERLFEQIAHYKMNAVVFEFEDKFQFRRHPVLSAPGAMTAEEVQRLARIARKHYVDLIPLVQTFGHLSFIAKHQEFAHLREVPISTWQLCPLKPGSLALARDVLDELIDATAGTRYVHIGGDEIEEIARGKECQEKWGDRAPVESYKVWFRFAVDHVKKRGRIPIVWDDMFLKYFKESDLADLPKDVIYMRWRYTSGEFPEKERMLLRNGFPVWIATAAQNMTPINPDQKLRVFNNAFFTQAGADLGIKGLLNTAWEDAGAHPETYWIGFIASAGYSWTAAKPTVEEFNQNFYKLFYGTRQRDLEKANDIISERGFLRFESSWSTMFKSLTMPPLPGDDYSVAHTWAAKHAALIAKAREMRPRYQEAVDIITRNLAENLDNRFSLEMMLLCARTQLHFTDLILHLNNLNDAFLAAEAAHKAGDDPTAMNHYHRAARLLEDQRYEKEQLFADTVRTWEVSVFPRDFRHIPGGRDKYVYQIDRELYYGNKSMDLAYIFEVEEKLGLFGYQQQLFETMRVILRRK